MFSWVWNPQDWGTLKMLTWRILTPSMRHYQIRCWQGENSFDISSSGGLVWRRWRHQIFPILHWRASAKSPCLHWDPGWIHKLPVSLLSDDTTFQSHLYPRTGWMRRKAEVQEVTSRWSSWIKEWRHLSNGDPAWNKTTIAIIWKHRHRRNVTSHHFLSLL